MLDKLPDELRAEVLHHLATDNFPAAKALYDQWKQSAPISAPQEQTQR